MSERIKASRPGPSRGILRFPGHWLRTCLAVMILAISGPLSVAHAATTDGPLAADSVSQLAGSHLESGSADQKAPDEPASQHHLHCAVCHCPVSMTARAQDSVIVPVGDRITYRLFDTSDVAKHDPSPLPEPPRG